MYIYLKPKENISKDTAQTVTREQYLWAVEGGWFKLINLQNFAK